jgi:hypothetical protein
VSPVDIPKSNSQVDIQVGSSSRYSDVELPQSGPKGNGARPALVEYVEHRDKHPADQLLDIPYPERSFA